MSAARSTGWLSDLVLVAVLAVGAMAALLVPNVPWPVEWVLGILLVVLLPGYALAAATFPERPKRTDDPREAASATPSEAVVFALALVGSALVVAVFGTALAATGRLELAPIVLVLVAVTLFGVLVAVLRRYVTSPEFRRAPLGRGVVTPVSGSLSGTRGQNVAFALAVVALLAAAGLTAAFPAQGEAYTEFAVLDENENGELVAEEFPSSIEAGEGHTFHFSVENHEHHAEDYTVVVVAQRVEDGEVTAQRQLDSFELELEPGERRMVDREVVPEQPGEDVRLKFLLYKDGVPAPVSGDNADVALQVWTNVTPSGDDADAGGNASATDSNAAIVDEHPSVASSSDAVAVAIPSGATLDVAVAAGY